MSQWVYFTARHMKAMSPPVELEIGRHRSDDPLGTCEILGRDGRWLPSTLLRCVTTGDLPAVKVAHRSLEQVADLANSYGEDGRYSSLPVEFPLWQGPMPAGPRWQYIVLGWWPVPGSPTNGHDFAYWMQDDLPKIPTGESVLRHDDITIGRTNRDDKTPFNFQRLDRDGTWVTGLWQDPGVQSAPDHLANEVTDQLALALIRDGYNLGYYRHLPTELPDPTTQTGWAAQTSQTHAGHARVHASLATHGPAGSDTWQ